MAKQSTKIKVDFPVLGENRRHAFDRSPQLTTVRALNVRGNDTEEGRLRGGLRPGTEKSKPQNLGGKVQLLDQIDYTIDNGITRIIDNFNGSTLLPAWTLNTLDTVPGFAVNPEIDGGFFDAWSHANGHNIVYEDTGNLLSSGVYTFSLGLTGTKNIITTDSIIEIIFKMDDAYTFATTFKSVILTFTNVTPGSTFPTAFVWTVQQEAVDTFISSPIIQTLTENSVITIVVNGRNVAGSIDGLETLNDTATGGSAMSTDRFGLRLNDGTDLNPSASGSDWGVDWFSVEGINPDNDDPYVGRRSLAVAGGAFWAEDDFGVMVLDTGPATLNPNQQLQGVSELSKYYIADFGDQQVTNIDGTIDTTGLIFEVAGEDFTAYNIDTDNHVIELFNSTGDIIDGIYSMLNVGTVALNKITLDVKAITGSAGGTCHYRIERGPKVYDPNLAAGSRLVNFVPTDAINFGTPPMGCTSVVRYRDRLNFANSLYSNNLWFQSRQGVPTDWNYFPDANEATKAVAGQNSRAGTLGEPITAVMPHSDDYLVFGSTNSLYILRGDAAAGGQIDNVSNTIGVLSRDAWCYGPTGELIFMSRDGIYVMPKGAAGSIKSASRNKIPEELSNIDTVTHNVSMSFDTLDRGVHIMVSPISTSGSSSHYFLQWDTASFWAVRFNNDDHDPFALHSHTANNIAESKHFMGCRDGFIRNFNRDLKLDDGSIIEPFLAIGPNYIPGDPDMDGILEYLNIDMDNDSDCAYVSIIVAENHDQVVDKTSAFEDEVFA